jgi:ATPase subunit of ABC transporter with duplicated ATPase domains
MINALGITLAAGGRELLGSTSFQIAKGDRVGLVGRNGAGKTTLCRVLAGEAQPEFGTVTRSGTIAYLPQDQRSGDLEVSGLDRILSARGLDVVTRAITDAEEKLGSVEDHLFDKAMASYARLTGDFESRGGWSASVQAASIASSLGLSEAVLSQSLGTLSGGQQRRVELARVLFSGADTLLLDEPTNHLDGDSLTWLRSFLCSFEGGIVLISHDVSLLETSATRVFHLDATRLTLDIYNMGWRAYLTQQASDDRRRVRERANAEKKIAAMRSQADRMRATATKARAAHNLDRRAARLLGDIAEKRKTEKVAKLRFPEPAPCGRTPLSAEGLAKRYGSLEVFTGVDIAIDRGSRVVVLGLNGAGKTTLLRILAGVDGPDVGEVIQGHGLRIGYYAQEHETLVRSESVFANLRRVAPASLSDVELRRVLGAFLFGGDRINQLAGTLSGGEKTRLALATLVVSSANVLLLDEPTNNLDPASRAEVLGALSSYPGAIVLVTHDSGAVVALSPERVLLMPDGVEDLWSDELADLIALA